jgi:hypothetical protein
MTSQDGIDGVGGMPVRDELRRLVREVLHELLPAAAADQPGPLNVTFNGSEHVERHVQRVAGRAPEGAGRPGGAAGAGRPGGAAGAGRPGGAAGAGRPGGAVRAVRLTTEEELHAFVVEVLRLAGDPQRRIDLLAGRIRFIPAQPAAGREDEPAAAVPAALRQGRPPGSARPAEPAAVAGQDGRAVRRVEKGAVTERAVIAAARAGARLVLGPRAVLTPLARDKARALGVPVEKER